MDEATEAWTTKDYPSVPAWPVVDLSGLTGEAWMEAKDQGLKDHPEAVIFKLVHPEWVLVMSGEEYERRGGALKARSVGEVTIREAAEEELREVVDEAMEAISRYREGVSETRALYEKG